MSEIPLDRRSLLRQDGSDPSDAVPTIAFPTPPHQVRGYHRVAQGSVDLTKDQPLVVPVTNIESNGQGLGITGGSSPINRVPVGARPSVTPPSPSKPFTTSASEGYSPMTPQTSASSKPLLSPVSAWPRPDSKTYSFGGRLARMTQMDQQDLSQGQKYFHGSLDGTFADDRKSNSTTGDHFNTVKGLMEGCPTTHDIHSSRASWLSISILLLSIYSTVFSGIWLMLAILQPRYGRTIHSGGSLTPSTASTLFALLAKTIELSFVTVFVTFIGQVISRRSLVKNSRGVTIPEMTMRTWVIQPGFMIAHWQHIQKAGATVIGIITLSAAFVAMFYTTASDALVSPHLKYGKWEEKKMWGLVQSSYANPNFIRDNCQTPINTAIDSADAAAYHNSLAYLETWTSISTGGEGAPTELSKRPPPVAMLFDNTTVTGSWVLTNSSNMTAAYAKYSRIINNVTMSMPHAGVFSAAHDARNGLLQPEDLAGVGEYSVRASVVSPSVNVLCANMNSTELAPLIYVEWPNATTNDSNIPGQQLAWSGYQNEVQLEQGQLFLNSTVVDDVFEWGETYQRQPPVFPMFPIDYNSMVNNSVANSDSIYILFKSSSTPDYTMCQLRSFISPACSTSYNVSGTNQGHLQSNCEDPSDGQAYNKSVAHAPVIRSTDWRNVGSLWSTALALNDGISNANSSTARLLSQLILTNPSYGPIKLNPLLPSLSETLAVMSGNTLLLSTSGSTYYHYWNYTANVLDPGTYLSFNASVASEEYTSGLIQRWQAIFYVILLLVFLTNLFCLIYLLFRCDLVTDFTEPQNLFALAVNSPPSERLSGSCGAGPEGDQLSVDWHVMQDEGSNHFFIKEGYLRQSDYELRKRREGQSLKTMSSYSKLSSTGKGWL